MGLQSRKCLRDDISSSGARLACRHGQATTVGGDFTVVRILRRVFYPAKVESEAGRVHVSRVMMGSPGLS
jgi:hypothetical protein